MFDGWDVQAEAPSEQVLSLCILPGWPECSGKGLEVIAEKNHFDQRKLRNWCVAWGKDKRWKVLEETEAKG